MSAVARAAVRRVILSQAAPVKLQLVYSSPGVSAQWWTMELMAQSTGWHDNPLAAGLLAVDRIYVFFAADVLNAPGAPHSSLPRVPKKGDRIVDGAVTLAVIAGDAENMDGTPVLFRVTARGPE